MAAGLSAVALGCSLALDVERQQCRTDRDCTDRGLDFRDSICDEVRSVCVGKQSALEGGDAGDGGEAGPPSAPPPELECRGEPVTSVPAGATFRVTLRSQDLLTATPLPNTSALLCRHLDTECAAPVVPPAVTDAAGDVTFEVPANFNGYVRFELPEYMVGLYYFNPPVREDRSVVSVQLALPGIASGLVGAVEDGLMRLETHGMLLITTQDCDRTPIGGIRYSTNQAEQDAIGFYVSGGAPQRAFPDSVTDTTGYGGFINAKPGYAEITATLLAEDLEIDKLSLLVKANAITYVTMVPDG